MWHRGNFAWVLFFISITTYGQRKNWGVPDFGVVQYAGSIGFFSAGMGYDVFESHGRFSVHFGMVPANRGGQLNVLSAKFFFKPKSILAGNRFKINPFDFGLMGSFHYGENFEERWPSGDNGYYWWNPAVRLHIAMESSIRYYFSDDHRLRSVTGYMEFNTNDLYLVSYFSNLRTLSFFDIVKIGTGLRVHF